MPLYTFKDIDTDEQFTLFLTNVDREIFLKENPHIQQLITSINIVSGVGHIKTDGGFKDVLHKIASANPTSALASSMGSSFSSKEVKTRQAVEKWRKKVRNLEGN
jgi:hypothetical protein